MADLEILPERLQGQRRGHSLGQEVGQHLQRGKVPHGLQVADVLAEEPIEPLLLPAPERAGRAGKHRLGEAAVLEERGHGVLGAPARDGELHAGRRDGGRAASLQLRVRERKAIWVYPLVRDFRRQLCG